MKGIVMAGGTGSRLFPITSVVNKHLLPIYDKPMIYHPISTLIERGIRDIAIVSNPKDLPAFTRLLGSGKNWGVSFTYLAQTKPSGVADVFRIAKKFIGKEDFTVILGDNLFYPTPMQNEPSSNYIFARNVCNPQEFGVLTIADDGALSIVEKPSNSNSNLAVAGLYVYKNYVRELASGLKASKRGELEITDLNNLLILRKELACFELPEKSVWIDGGTISGGIEGYEASLDYVFGYPELAAASVGLLNKTGVYEIARKYPKSIYRSRIFKMIGANEPL